VDEEFLDELVELRNALANIKTNTEEYVRQSTEAAGALERLTKSLGLLRALKIYQDADDLMAQPLTDLKLSVRAYCCLESEGITTVGELCRRSPEELLEVRNFGETTLHEVVAKLAERGLELAGG
jgi:DNA-directed RNA polymerase alpha subunit